MANNMRLDVTHLFDSYRECARHLRNTAFSTRESKDWQVVDDFQEIARLLFEKLVLQRVAASNGEHPLAAIEENRFLIEPSGAGMNALVSRDAAEPGYWDHPVNTLMKGEAVLSFQDFFDWDEHGLCDLRYYRAKIIESARYPEITGHEALVETTHAKIIFYGSPPEPSTNPCATPDKTLEAEKILREEIAQFGGRIHAELVPLAKSQHMEAYEINSPSGAAYKIEIQFLWDSQPGGVIRIAGSVSIAGHHPSPLFSDMLLVMPIPS